MRPRQVIDAADRAQLRAGTVIDRCALLAAVETFLDELAASAGWRLWVRLALRIVRAAVRAAREQLCPEFPRPPRPRPVLPPDVAV